MKRRKTSCIAEGFDDKQSKILHFQSIGLIFVLVVLSTLCISAVAQENTAEGWYKKGQELDRNGSFDEAVKAYDRAIELDPGNATLWTAKVPSLNMLALITKNQSKRNESIKALDKALQIDPKNLRALDLKGSTLSQMKRYNESLEAYDKGIESVDEYQGNRTDSLSTLWLSKAIALWQSERYNESLEAIDKAVLNVPENYDAWMFKGQVLAYLGRYNESVQAFDMAADIGTASSRPELESFAWVSKGYPLMAMDRYKDARDVYENITKLNFTENTHTLAAGWQGLGNSLAMLGQYNESINAYNKTIELSLERAPYAWIGIGNDLRDMGRYGDAIKAYDKAIEIEPRIGQAWKGLGDSLIKLDKRDEAVIAYDKAVMAYDENIRAFNNATNVDKAISFTFDPYPLDANFWYSRGSALKALGRNSEAEAACAKAEELGYNG